MAEPHERSLRSVPPRQTRPRAGKLCQILQDGRQWQPKEPRRSGGRERETKATSEVQTLADTCITGPGQTRREPGTRTLLFHWWRPAGKGQLPTTGCLCLPWSPKNDAPSATARVPAKSQTRKCRRVLVPGHVLRPATAAPRGAFSGRKIILAHACNNWKWHTRIIPCTTI